MKLLRILSLLLLVLSCEANEEALALAKRHFSGSLLGDRKVLVETYAEKVSLKPGHEFLKKDYGLVGEGMRDKGAEVARAELVDVIVALVADRPPARTERIKGVLKTLKYTVMETEVGDYSADSSDPIGSTDGKLHFKIAAGDILVKAAPAQGDFVLFQLRKLDGKWRVVAEYLD